MDLKSILTSPYYMDHIDPILYTPYISPISWVPPRHDPKPTQTRKNPKKGSKDKKLFSAATISDKINAVMKNTVFTLLEDGEEPKNFEIKENGEMYVRSKLDREVKDRYEMTIGAKNRDTGDLIEEETTVSLVTGNKKGNERVPKRVTGLVLGRVTFGW